MYTGLTRRNPMPNRVPIRFAVMTNTNDVIGTGTKVFDAEPVHGVWRRLNAPDDVLDLMDTSAEGVIACVADAGATFLAPIFDDLAGVVCLSGTPLSHIGIVSREYQVPCIMGTQLVSEPEDGSAVEIDCSGAVGIVRTLAAQP